MDNRNPKYRAGLERSLLASAGLFFVIFIRIRGRTLPVKKWIRGA